MAHAQISTSDAQAELGKLNSAHLYSMQIQGAGKLSLPDGTFICASGDERRGHAFTPSLQSMPRQAREAGAHQVVTAPSPAGPSCARAKRALHLARRYHRGGRARGCRHDPERARRQSRITRRDRSIVAIRSKSLSKRQAIGSPAADYFRVFGDQAFIQASRMKEDGQIWMLLSKNKTRPVIFINTASPVVPGVIGRMRFPECLAPDVELCVE
jgi:hypothetical protein